MRTGTELIAEERQEQIEKHGYSAIHDDIHTESQLKLAAIYAIDPNHENEPSYYGYNDWDWFVEKIDLKKNAVERLKVAGALIAAEIDRLQRKQLK